MLDRDTIVAALRRLAELLRAEQARDIVARYYPEDRIPARVVYLLDDIFAGRGTTS